jgi:hypothetical protein
MRDPYIREKFTRNLVFARELAREYLERYPNDLYETKVAAWREIQSYNIEFVMKPPTAVNLIAFRPTYARS